MNKILIIIFLFLYITIVFGASNGYWLRGDDFKTFMDGSQVNFMTASAPNISSTETMLKPNEEGIIGQWFTTSFREGLQLHTNVIFWSNGLEFRDGNVIWELYDSNPNTQKNNLIISGEIKQGEEESKSTLEETYNLAPGSRLKLVLKSNNENVEITLEKGDISKKSEWTSPTGENFLAKGIEKTALLFLNQCSIDNIACSNNEGCDDGNPFTKDICNNPGVCEASCSYEECTPKCITGEDCRDGNPLTIDVCENSGTCEANCGKIKCEPVCGIDSQCDDSDSGTRDVCLYQGTCFAKCENTELGETTLSESACKITECTNGDCNEETKLYCCGNDWCEQGEECQEDCERVELEVIKPAIGDYVNFGETFNVVVKAKNGEIITAKGFFGEQQLLDDGKHNDRESNDGVFGWSFTIENKEAKTETIVIENRQGEKIYLHLSVVPLLETILETNGTNFVLTDFLEIKGRITRKSVPIKGKIILKAEKSGLIIFEEEQELDQFGNFEHSYKSFSTNPTGKWIISVKGEDEFGNKAEQQIIVNFVDPEESLPLKIQVLNEIKENYKRNDFLGLEARVNTAYSMVEDAKVEARLGNNVMPMTNKGNGVYSLDTQIPGNVSSGSIRLIITAEKGSLNGRKILNINIQSEEILIKMFEQTKKTYQIGETILFVFVLNYKSGLLVENAKVELTVNGGKVELTERNDIYTGGYLVQEEGEIEAIIEADDTTKNHGAAMLNFKAKGHSILYYTNNFREEIIIGAVLLVIIFSGLFLFYRRGEKSKALLKREKELTEKIRNVQTRYFKLEALSREKYDELMIKYEQELGNVKKQLKKK